MKNNNSLNGDNNSNGVTTFYQKVRFASTAIVLTSAYLSIAACQSTPTRSACTLTSGCISTSCVSNKQYKYNSSGQRQCCAC